MIKQEKLNHLRRDRLTSYAKDVYLMMLAGIFSQTNSNFHYDPDDDKTKLMLADRFQKPLEDQAFKPLIYLHRGRMSFTNSAMNQLLEGNMNTHTQSFTDLVQGTMILNCVSSEGLEAEDLASNVFTVLQAYRHEFGKLGFQNFMVNELLEERPLNPKYDADLVEVPVVTSFTFQHTWCRAQLNLTALQDVCIQRAKFADGDVSVQKPMAKDLSDGTVDTTNPSCNLGKVGCGEFGPIDDDKTLILRP